MLGSDLNNVTTGLAGVFHIIVLLQVHLSFIVQSNSTRIFAKVKLLFCQSTEYSRESLVNHQNVFWQILDILPTCWSAADFSLNSPMDDIFVRTFS